jgi:hypothetical protein
MGWKMKCELRLKCRGRKADGILQPIKYQPPGLQTMSILISSVLYSLPRREIGGKYVCFECGQYIYKKERSLMWTIGAS